MPENRFDFPESPLIPPETEAETWLYGLSRFGMKLGLANIRELARRHGDPQKSLRFLHVAGTNGKGSVCFFIESLLRSAGVKAGVFASPHLVHVGERVRVDGQLLSHEMLASYVERIRADVEELRATFFEAMTLIALLRFAEAGVQAVAWETGLGGRYDSTRVADPAMTAITRIGLDHTRYLGTTLEEIAADKMGIARPGLPLLTGQEPGSVLDHMRGLATESGVELVALPPLDLEGLPPFQRGNAALALRLVEGLYPGTDEEAHRVLLETRLPGRFHVVGESPARVIDGAHNPQALEAVLDRWAELGGGTLIFGCNEDKEVAPLLDQLRTRSWPLILTRADNPRSLPAEDLMRRAGSPEGWMLAPHCAGALEAAGEGPWLLTGSFYLAGEAYWNLGLRPFGGV